MTDDADAQADRRAERAQLSESPEGFPSGDEDHRQEETEEVSHGDCPDCGSENRKTLDLRCVR